MFIWGLFESVFSAVVSLLFLLAVVTTIVVIVMDNRNPYKTLAWVLVLVFLPVVGLALYYFFGQDTRREKLISKKGFKRLTKYPMMEFQMQESFKVSEEKQHQLIRFFQRVNLALPFEGNSMKIFQDGSSMLQALLATINSAKHHIHVEFYIFEDDAVGCLVKDALIEKAREGVEIRVLYDDVGCWKVPHRFYDEMREVGIEVRGFLKVRFPRFTSKVNYRNHRKLVVVDGRIGFVGGMNLAERYLKGVPWGIWKDIMMQVEGKAVYGLQMAFLTDWYATDHSLITSSSYFPQMEDKGTSLMQVVTSDPVGEWKDIMQGLLIAITSAQKYVYIQSPYLLPTEPILLALKTAAAAGVDVRIMIPEKSDSRMVHWGTMSYLQELMEAGIKIYMYQKGFLHSKLIVCDDCLSSVGSTNMDFRSFEHNFEINAFMYDKTSALMLKDIFLSDQKDAKLLHLKEWRMRPWSQKVKESVIRLFAPLL
jgi:cardiolipin synthase